MTSPMIDLYGEHWPIPVDENGDGPVEEAHAVKEVCAECSKDWPCPTSELITELRKENADLSQRVRFAKAYMARKERTAHNLGMVQMALDGFSPDMLMAADLQVPVSEADRIVTRLVEAIKMPEMGNAT